MSHYSVWNQGTGLFDYYESSRAQATLNVEKPTHLRGSQTLGAFVGEAAWPLPSDARPVGSGSMAIGRVARARGSVSATGDVFDSDTVRAGVLIGAAFLLYKYVVKSPRRRHR